MYFLLAVSHWMVSLLITRKSNGKISDWTQKGTSPIYCILVKYIILKYNRNYNSKGLKAASLFLDFVLQNLGSLPKAVSTQHSFFEYMSTYSNWNQTNVGNQDH